MAAEPDFAAVGRDTMGVAPALMLAASYNREVRAGIDRIWENVFDWQHLPVLHESYFNHVALIELGDRGWRVALTKQPGTPDRRMVLDLHADRENRRYRVRTLEGDGAGTEIWTLLMPLGPQRTAIEVRYYLPERPAQKLALLGEKYRHSCGRLWDEDEAMMVRREALSARVATAPRYPVPLGPVGELRRRLPLRLEVDGEPFRIVALEGGELVAHSTICPHWLGPLAEAAPHNGVLRCPWHGFLFDLRTGESADRRGYRLAPAARVVVDPTSGEAVLIPAREDGT